MVRCSPSMVVRRCCGGAAGRWDAVVVPIGTIQAMVVAIQAVVGRSRREAEKQGVARAGADALEAVGMSSPIAGSCRGVVAGRRGRDAGDTERGSFVRVTEW
ncbi:hypothetical protein R6Q59_030324 [Mikania micrantha]